jgi:Tfp pilus assembly protein PilF
MSLLLQALQKAAKSREDGEGETASIPASADELTLDPMEPEPTLQEEMPISRPTSAQAATVVQAGRVPGFDPIDYARDHQMIVFLALAVLAAIGYGLYVYIQISNPGLFRSSPRPVPATGPLASASTQGTPPATVPPPAAAKISGMPATTFAAPVAPAPTVLDEPATLAQPDTAAKPARARRLTRVSGVAADRVIADASVETVVVRSSNDPSGISVLRQPATVEPVNPTLMQAYEALQSGELAQARSLYQQVLHMEPRSVDALLGLGAIAWKEGRIEDATQHYQRVLELEPRNSFAQAGLIAIIGGADRQGSESRLKQLIAREPSPFLYFTLGNLYAEQGQWPGAEQAYFQAYQQQPDNPDYAFNLAIGLEHLGQTRLALEHYRKALDLSFRKGHANFDQSLVIQRVGQLSTRVEQ